MEGTGGSGQSVIPIPLSELHPFPNHPFKVRDDDAMNEMVESVMEYGILTPAIVRPRQAGGYEIVAGHRRKRACELAGLEALASIVQNLDDDMATILMVDSNLQREDILPTEKAQAYKMKMNAIKRQGARTDLTSPQAAAKFRADDEIAKGAGISGDTVRRYIRLNELSPQLQQMVDNKKIAITPAVELSYLKPEEQGMLLDAIRKGGGIPTLAQAQRLKRASQSGAWSADTLRMVLAAEKPPKRAAPPKPDQGQDKPPKEAQSPSSPPDPPAAEFPPPDPPFSPGDKQYATFEESVKALKDTEKDCSCTPDIFLATIAEFVKRFLGEIDWYMGEYYAPVFLSLSPVQLRYLRQQMDQICNAAEQLYQSVKGAHEHE